LANWRRAAALTTLCVRAAVQTFRGGVQTAELAELSGSN
jgi:hypothetical protein